MTSDQLLKVYVPHLSGQFERARPILFTGAGFSLGVRNLSGNTVPSYSELTGLLWNLCFPGSDYDGSGLQELYEDALQKHKKQLSDLLLSSFTVDPKNIPDWYRPYFELPWQRAYTLNIDDLGQAANSAFSLGRSVLGISATNPNLIVSGAQKRNLEMVHLNGNLEDVPDRVTFSVTQYAERAQLDQWYIRFTADLVTSPVVFIGTRLDEPPLWQHLVLRHHKASRETENRHRSYLVTPLLDRAKASLLAKYNVVWIQMDAETFSREVLSHLSHSSSEGHSYLNSLSDQQVGGTSKMHEVTDLAVNPGESNEFLLGNEPIWADIQSGRAAQREIDNDLWALAKAVQAKPDMKGVLLITGTAGSGKSTSLKRLCLKMSSEGTRVGWVDRQTELTPGAIRAAMRQADPPQVLAIDDADLYGFEMARILRDVSLHDKHPLVVISARSGKVDRVLNPAVLEAIPLLERSMPPLIDSDIEGILNVLEKEKRLGVLTRKSRSEQIQAFRNEAGRQLLVAMIKATLGKELKDKAFEELHDLDSPAQLVYAVVCTASAYRFGLYRDEILIACRDTTNTTLNVVTQLLQRHILFSGSDGMISARHRIIAELVRDELQSRGQMAKPIAGLAILAAAKVGENLNRGARPWRMLRVFINHDLLLRTCGVESARNLYGELEELLSWDYHFWLQRGSLEVEYDNLPTAERYLSTARSLSDSDHIVDTEWAYLLFRKAVELVNAESDTLVAEATAILEDLMPRVGDTHPYHIMGSQGLAWSRRGITDPKEKEKYLRRLTVTLEEGCKKYPREKELESLLHDLRKEYLSLAIKPKRIDVIP